MSIGNQSSNKWTPKEDDEKGQVEMLSLAMNSDLNFLAQTLNLLEYSPDGRKKFITLLTRENVKRRYFKQIPTYDLKKTLESLSTDLDDADREILSPKEQQEKIEEYKKNKEKALEEFAKLNRELKALKLPEIT